LAFLDIAGFMERHWYHPWAAAAMTSESSNEINHIDAEPTSVGGTAK